MNHPPCSVDGCDRPLKTRGMCKLHYDRWHRQAVREGTFTRIQRRAGHIPPEEGIAEFEMVMGDTTDILTACRRVGVHPRTVIRWYERTGKPKPHGIYRAEMVASGRIAA